MTDRQVAPDPAGAQHLPVLPGEVLAGLAIQPGMRIIDATLGGGGHTTAMLRQSAPDGQVLGLDADPAAIRRVMASLAAAIEAQRLTVVQANFVEIGAVAQAHSFTEVDAILLDLGLSSFQLETPERGFSLLQPGPLDMRFDPEQLLSAAEIVNEWPEEELADILYRYGEERRSRRIARHLVRKRPIATTEALAEEVSKAVGGRRGQRIHPATKTFQALRIAVNDELAHLEEALPQCLALLRPGGRLAVISFHSLEDRIVKHWIQQEARTWVPDAAHPLGGYERTATLTPVTRKPITASAAELAENPRSRSAKLRIAERR
jgi:16S rRNA (cytosine1402-N4)-methyltransferase